VAVTCQLDAKTLTRDHSDRLLEWCCSMEASDFTVSMIAVEDAPAEPLVDLETALAPHSLGFDLRQVLVNPVGPGGTRAVPLWRLSPETVALLHPLLPDGILTYRIDEENGWLEDLVIYRGGQLLLGVVSHEGEAILELSLDEYRSFSMLGIPSRDQGPGIR
jgi:hypothetical protein